MPLESEYEHPVLGLRCNGASDSQTCRYSDGTLGLWVSGGGEGGCTIGGFCWGQILGGWFGRSSIGGGRVLVSSLQSGVEHGEKADRVRSDRGLGFRV